MEMIDKIVFNECRKTFMEQMKVHKRETAFAAILAYYLKPLEDHGLNDLFLKALLKKIDLDTDYNANKVNIQLEKSTKKGNRIDILISTEKFVLCIEFKIDHKLNNDLYDYVDFVNKEFNDSIVKKFILLTPNRKPFIGKAIGNTDFQEIILSHYFQEIQNEFKKEEDSYKDNPKLQFYNDLVQTVNNRKIRSQRYNTLKEIEHKLNRTALSSKFHKNINGGFIEIEENEKIFKFRIKDNGWLFEKCKADKKIDCQIPFELSNEITIDEIVIEIKRLIKLD